ncbi:G-protein-signaling modulator 1-like isoform X1 [Hydractinia symbiolongicarpus]|uniref:G-protein-signaling modulator 1-like isoform X1 n=1 Tax=Hydractinia symbiolongicarpus TaxID=13093 RepID=UPI00254FE4D3|nr:G-protein-signaling modulator 1-like isoform X1 [Hydractinia symbiolongicarpus]
MNGVMDLSCMELALQGEQFCKNGDCRSGVEYFEAAIKVGTEDLKTLSAVYSQLGNAYFYLQEYEKALEFHRHDLTLARTLGDRLGEAKASGNLGNTLKVLGKFDEAIFCCTRHLDTSRELKDKIGEARALYNLGNVYHAKGKHLGRSRHRDPGNFPFEVQQALERAVEFYEANLILVNELGDRAAEGRAYGNLGNTHYLLGNFDKAVQYHEERLLIAREFQDKAAERRAFSNLGNAHVFLGEFEIAVEYYKKTKELAQELNDKAIEAQACYSLGNTCTLLKRYNLAVDYHLEHLNFAKTLKDRVGEGRAYWSLGNAYTALGQHSEALTYAEKHLFVSKEVGDRTGELTAEMNIVDLKAVLGLDTRKESSLSADDVQKLFSPGNGANYVGTDSSDVTVGLIEQQQRNNSGVKKEGPGEDFFDLLYKSQSSRLNDQRCEFPMRINMVGGKKYTTSVAPKKPVAPTVSVNADSFMDMVVKMQGDRMDEQRSAPPELPGLAPQVKERLLQNQNEKREIPDDKFLDMLMRSQSTRINDQRCDFPPVPRGPTVPDEDFFNLIVRLQSKRIDAQRVSFDARKHSF